MKPASLISQTRLLIDRYYQKNKLKYINGCKKLYEIIDCQLNNYLNSEYNETDVKLLKKYLVAINYRKKKIKNKNQVLRKVLSIIRNNQAKSLRNAILTNDFDLFSSEIVKHMSDFSGLEIVLPYKFMLTRFSENLIKTIKTKGYKIIKENNYLLNPQNDGYRAIHILIEFNNYPYELQIKTALQEAWGRFTHDVVYKPIDTIHPSKAVQLRFETLASLLDAADSIAQEIYHSYIKERHDKQRKIGP